MMRLSAGIFPARLTCRSSTMTWAIAAELRRIQGREVPPAEPTTAQRRDQDPRCVPRLRASSCIGAWCFGAVESQNKAVRRR